MSKTSPFTIVVGVDFEESGSFAFAEAARVAAAIPSSQLHLVHVSESAIDDAKRRELVGSLRTYVNENAKSLGGLGGVTIAIHLRMGEVVHEVVQLATDVGANMIVVGATKGPHLKTWLLGSVSERLLLGATCPVLVAGPRPRAFAEEPRIDPPCGDCEQVRARSNSTQWWCERHARHGERAHVFSYQREIPLATHDSNVIPTGIELGRQ